MIEIGTRVFWRKLDKPDFKPGFRAVVAQGVGDFTGYDAQGSPVIRDSVTRKKIVLKGKYQGFVGGRCIS